MNNNVIFSRSADDKKFVPGIAPYENKSQQKHLNMKSLPWNGIYSAMLTPMTHIDTIDYDMLKHNINVQIEAGVHGLIFGGSLGEASTLAFDERNELLIHARDYAGGRVPVLINIAEQTIRDAIKVANHAELNGAAGLMLLPPMRYKSDEA